MMTRKDYVETAKILNQFSNTIDSHVFQDLVFVLEIQISFYGIQIWISLGSNLNFFLEFKNKIDF